MNANITPTDVLIAAKRDRLCKLKLVSIDGGKIVVNFSDLVGLPKTSYNIQLSNKDTKNYWVFEELGLDVPKTKNKFTDKVTTKNSRPTK